MSIQEELAKKLDWQFDLDCQSANDWHDDITYLAYMSKFGELLSAMMDENIKLGPEGQWVILDALKEVIAEHKQEIIDDCYDASREAIEMMPEIGNMRDMGDM